MRTFLFLIWLREGLQARAAAMEGAHETLADELHLEPLVAEGKGGFWRGHRCCVAEGGGLLNSRSFTYRRSSEFDKFNIWRKHTTSQHSGETWGPDCRCSQHSQTCSKANERRMRQCPWGPAGQASACSTPGGVRNPDCVVDIS